MEFSNLLTKMTQAICQERPIDVAECFCEDGEYHDVFYGQFVGRKNIIDLIKNYFYRNARGFDRIYMTQYQQGLSDIAGISLVLSQSWRLRPAEGWHLRG